MSSQSPIVYFEGFHTAYDVQASTFYAENLNNDPRLVDEKNNQPIVRPGRMLCDCMNGDYSFKTTSGVGTQLTYLLYDTPILLINKIESTFTFDLNEAKQSSYDTSAITWAKYRLVLRSDGVNEDYIEFQFKYWKETGSHYTYNYDHDLNYLSELKSYDYVLDAFYERILYGSTNWQERSIDLNSFFKKKDHEVILRFMAYTVANPYLLKGPILSIMGPTNSGKSDLGRILTRLLGDLKNVVIPDIDTLDTIDAGWFENAISKSKLCILDENTIKFMKKGKLKRLTGAIPTTSRQIGKAVETLSTNPPFIFATNDRPFDKYYDEAFYARMRCIDTTKPKNFKVDIEWTENNILHNQDELAGILYKLKDAYQRLIKDNWKIEDGLDPYERFKKFDGGPNYVTPKKQKVKP